VTANQFNVAAEVVGFLSALCLTWQTYRLVSHQKIEKELRDAGSEGGGSDKLKELATAGAATLRETIGRWDRKDQWFVVTGLAGLSSSFLMKLIGLTVF
jgi:hypothetical protein